MNKRMKLIGAALGFVVSASLNVQAMPVSDTANKISVTARCIDQMKAYRTAIGFIADRLEKSPAALTYVRQNGETLTIQNRIHHTMQYERRVLEAGMQARARTCAKALVS